MGDNYNSSNDNRVFATDFLVSLRNTSIVLFVILGIVFAVLYSKNYINVPGVSNEYSEAIDNAVWCHETFTKWNELYDSGDYAKMVEVVSEEYDSKRDTDTWIHYDFYSRYRNYLEALGYIESNPDGLTGLTLYTYVRILTVEGSDYLILTKSDKQALSDAREHLIQIMFENYGLDPDDTEALIEQLAPEGYAVYNKCTEYADEYNKAHAQD